MSDAAGDAARALAAARLDEAAAQGRVLQFWWRDDDAEDVTPALDRLLALAARHGPSLALAVVPKGATEALADRLSTERGIAVLQHGWAHRNHAADGEKKIELGGRQSLSSASSELRNGRAKLAALFPAFLPVLVPPWNRIADDIRAALPSLGLHRLSTFGPAEAPHQVNTHLDIFAWRPARRTLSREEAFTLLAAEIERRIAGSEEPIGLLTHHLVHEEESWALLDELLSLLTQHPAARWPKIDALFGL